MRWDDSDFDYDGMAATYLTRRSPETIPPRCQAMFIDEAQDMGPNTLKLLSALVEQTEPEDPKSRAVNIFYDNAQNIYLRSTPRWSEMGLDMRGRSTVMKESFRSTRPITEFALNLLYLLQPADTDPDHKELVERGLIEKTDRRGVPWWAVRFNQVDGPPPIFKKYRLEELQIAAVADQIVRWIRDEGVSPGDICVVYNRKHIRDKLERNLAPRLPEVRARLVVHEGLGDRRSPDAVVASTLHSFKGYDSEIVVVVGLEQFVSREEGILANNLYVAMTRARSILAVYGCALKEATPDATRLLSAVQDCLDVVLDCPAVERETSRADQFEDVLQKVGRENREWLANLWNSYLIQQEPIQARDGEILADPLFWFQVDDRVIACFGRETPGTSTLHKLQDASIAILRPGENPPGAPTA